MSEQGRIDFIEIAANVQDLEVCGMSGIISKEINTSHATDATPPGSLQNHRRPIDG